MVLSKLYSILPTSRNRDKENEKKYIIKGYPTTTFPVVPDILKHQVEFKKLMRGPWSTVGLTLAHEGTDLVMSESLEMFRKRLLGWLKRDQVFCENFKSEFPKNLIAISLALFNFELGESCQEYKLTDSVKPSENGHFTYRKLSECIQCTYYNANGNEFLAGITFYPAPHGRSLLLGSNDALLFIANRSFIEYPLVDRHKSFYMVEYKQYGRFCSTAGKHVLLRMDVEDDGVPRHVEYNHVTNNYEHPLCDECCRDYYTYKWEKPNEDTSVTSAQAITVEESVPTATVATDSEASAVSRPNSTESFIEEFVKIDSFSGNVPPPC